MRKLKRNLNAGSRTTVIAFALPILLLATIAIYYSRQERELTPPVPAATPQQCLQFVMDALIKEDTVRLKPYLRDGTWQSMKSPYTHPEFINSGLYAIGRQRHLTHAQLSKPWAAYKTWAAHSRRLKFKEYVLSPVRVGLGAPDESVYLEFEKTARNGWVVSSLTLGIIK